MRGAAPGAGSQAAAGTRAVALTGREPSRGVLACRCTACGMDPSSTDGCTGGGVCARRMAAAASFSDLAAKSTCFALIGA